MNIRSFSPAIVLVLASFVSGADPAPRPIERAREGQWVLEKQTHLGDVTDASYMATWVEKVDGRKIHLKRQEVSSDRKTGVSEATALVVDLEQKRPAAAEEENKAVLLTDENVVIDGKTLKCKKSEVVVVDANTGKTTTITWISPDVPLFGLVRSVRLDKDGKELGRTEIMTWADSGGAELPVPQKN